MLRGFTFLRKNVEENTLDKLFQVYQVCRFSTDLYATWQSIKYHAWPKI